MSSRTETRSPGESAPSPSPPWTSTASTSGRTGWAPSASVCRTSAERPSRERSRIVSADSTPLRLVWAHAHVEPEGGGLPRGEHGEAVRRRGAGEPHVGHLGDSVAGHRDADVLDGGVGVVDDEGLERHALAGGDGPVVVVVAVELDAGEGGLELRGVLGHVAPRDGDGAGREDGEGGEETHGRGSCGGRVRPGSVGALYCSHDDTGAARGPGYDLGMPADLQRAFPTVLRRLREERDMTQEDLAHESGVSRISIARFETGRRLPSLPTLFALADGLGVSAAQVIEFTTQEALSG